MHVYADDEQKGIEGLHACTCVKEIWGVWHENVLLDDLFYI